ncbi:hypothetical protein CDD82_5074 [Ophiocordyceps australis]|uniref:Methyltransferase domain-containing protein n=1 Tax=Ophiocordyceps australis TaxID=1399860 RepID=A0A2C5Y4B9_9HYPO|nr:hypothetical protein CDD82_5074 [Ophiocordyceps australis]
MPWHLSDRSFGLGVVVGFLGSLALAVSLATIVLRTRHVYSLGHWKLNMRTPLRSMWMNLGYWKTPDGKPVEYFDEACQGLLRAILEAAGLLTVPRVTDGDTDATPKGTAVLDLGFGCGDQTLALARLVPLETRRKFGYVGLTLNETQVRTATGMLDRELVSCAGAITQLPHRACFTLYCADAARPDTWSPAIRQSVQQLADQSFTQRWLLALDCLYHFSPSRRPILQFAARKLDAGVMAFDLILNEQASTTQRLLVRAVGIMMNCPWHTFLTEDEYRAQLVECGYDTNTITIQDISDNVFAGVSGYILRQEAALGRYGISIGGFKLAARLFAWFDRTRVVKAVIVVGRSKGKTE